MKHERRESCRRRGWVIWGLIVLLGAGWDGSWAKERRVSPIVKAVARARPAVVSIQGRKRLRSATSLVDTSSGREVQGMGTGVVIDPRGYILTNYHVVEGVRHIEVTTADRTTVRARLVARDRETDLAVIRVDMPKPLPVIPIGTSSDLMQGETVIAVGNAYGYDSTVTTGVISALHRPVQISDDQQYDDLIQTDASINPGNSGGPLLNIDGEMIGVNVAVRVGAQGIGFAIPVDAAIKAAARLLAITRIDRNTHGMIVQTSFDDESEAPVATIARVVSGGPADRADLEAGDILRKIGGREIRHELDVELAFLGKRAGVAVPVVFERDGVTREVNLTLDRLGLQDNGAGVERLLWQQIGIRVEPVSRSFIQHLAAGYSGGLRVLAVRPGSAAVREGLRRGDILVGLHKWETATLDNVRFILQSPEVRRQSSIKFFILRGRQTLYGWFDISGR